MRPIDADGVIRSLASLKYYYGRSETEEANNRAVNDCICEIESAPTLDVKPVVHAHWIRGAFADLTCSNCKFSLCVPYSAIPKLAYCPCCGALISEEEGNDKQRTN